MGLLYWTRVCRRAWNDAVRFLFDSSRRLAISIISALLVIVLLAALGAVDLAGDAVVTAAVTIAVFAFLFALTYGYQLALAPARMERESESRFRAEIDALKARAIPRLNAVRATDREPEGVDAAGVSSSLLTGKKYVSARYLGDFVTIIWENPTDLPVQRCRGYITAIMDEQDGRKLLFDPIPCPWVVIDGAKHEAEIPSSGSRRLRVLVMLAGNLHLCTDKVPVDYVLIFQKGRIYTVDVTVSSDNAASARARLRVDWTGEHLAYSVEPMGPTASGGERGT